MLGGIKRRMLECVVKNAPIPVYKLAKELGLSYGSAQWHVAWLEKAGFVKSVRIGKRRYVIPASFDPTEVVKVEDFVEELKRSLDALGVRPEMGMKEALAILRTRGEGELADLILNFWHRTLR